MENAITAGLSKQIVLTRALDIAANNIANQTTPGYKAEKTAFREYIARIEGPESGDPEVSLVYDSDSYTDFSPGGLEQTHASFDFAIDGDGFFAVETADGVRYTRDGHFGLNLFGELVNRDGARVLDANGASILFDPEAGPVLLSPEGELQQDDAPVAVLGVYTVDDTRQLRKEGANLFAAAPGAEPFALQLPRIRQGFIETSNVAPISSVTDMIEIMRAYEQASQVAEIANQLARDAVRTLSQEA
ncbi:MAG: flagellar basal-body rod protein FlgF [Parvularculaceae bacterium]